MFIKRMNIEVSIVAFAWLFVSIAFVNVSLQIMSRICSVWTPKLATILIIFASSINCFVITERLTSKLNGLRFSIKSCVKHALNVSWVLGRRRQPIVSDPFLSSDDVTPAVQCTTVHGPKQTALGVNKVVIPHDGGAFLWWQNKIGRTAIHTQIDLIRSFNFLKIL